MNFVATDFASRFGRDGFGRAPSDNRGVRLRGLSLCVLLWALAVVARLYSLQISDFETWQEWALKQHFREVQVSSERGPIVDREGKLLALSIPATSIYVRPRQIARDLTKEKIAELAALLEMEPSAVREKFSEKKNFVWLRRQVPRARGTQIAELKIAGIGTMLEAKRVYPFNSAAATVIGKVGVDGVGLSGLEGLYDKRLKGEHVRTRATRDALGTLIQIPDVANDQFSLPKGMELKLTLDAGLQLIADEELDKGKHSANAEAAMALMVDANSGEILAMSQSPNINLNDPGIPGAKALSNLVLEATFEPGSIMKPIVAAAALESGVVSPHEVIDCSGGRFSFASHVIKDVHPFKDISFFDVVVRSSNIGMTKVGTRLGAERLYSALTQFGFGKRSTLGLPGESGGILRPVSSWAKVDVATHSFGQGVAVTPIQMVRAVSAIANGGRLPQLRIVECNPEEGACEASAEQPRIISTKTARTVREMMYGVVEDEHGTGAKAAVTGLRIGGKTGTAQKSRVDGRGYEPGAYVASFVGFADGHPLGVERTLALLVMIDEAHTDSIYGGTLAAPVFQKIMNRSMQYLAMKETLGREAPATPAPQNKSKLDYAKADSLAENL